MLLTGITKPRLNQTFLFQPVTILKNTAAGRNN